MSVIKRRALLAGAIAVAAGGGASACDRLSGREDSSGAPSTSPSGAFPTGSVGASGPQRAVMMLRPTWIPDDVPEILRNATVGDPRFVQRRAWRTPDGSNTAPMVFVDLYPPKRVAGSESYTKPGDVEIAGRPAWVHANSDDTGPAQVEWLFAEQMLAVVSVSARPQASQVALRMARSLTEDGQATCEVALRFGWLPEGVPGDRLTLHCGPLVDGVPGQGLTLERYDLSHSPMINVRVGSKNGVEPIGGGEQVTVRGRPAVYLYKVDAGGGAGALETELEDGRRLNMHISGFPSPKLSHVDMIRIVESMWIGPAPESAWLRSGK